ncbi:MAG: carboxylase, partial [Dysgonamonadaceae bacterium]|nr:carboxylase [Dysgonamonadaceae bacterium]
VKYIKKYGGMADCAVCYTVDPKFDEPIETKKKGGFFSFLKNDKPSKPVYKEVFTDDYFLNKAKEMTAMGADMITIKDMSGLIPPSRVATLIPLFKKELNVPIDFHTHCTPGFGLGAVLTAIMHGADIVDTVIWNFAGGPAAPAVELIYIFCKKLGIELDINMEAVAKINYELLGIRKELKDFDVSQQIPNPFNPLTDTLPAQIDKEFDNSIEAVKSNNEKELLRACHAIEAYFNFPKPDELVKNAEIPGGMYTNMVAQLKQYNSLDILEDAMKLIPSVRLDAGLPPLVTPTSQIVGAQAVASALNYKNDREKYANPSNQFVALVKGEYGETPVAVDPEFRLKITGSRDETPYDTSNYKRQNNPTLDEYGGVRLAQNAKEELLLELFPTVGLTYLKGQRKDEYEAKNNNVETGNTMQKEDIIENKIQTAPKEIIESPMPGSIMKILVKEGETVEKGKVVLILEAMKMENDIVLEVSGTVSKILVEEGSFVQAGSPMIEII